MADYNARHRVTVILTSHYMADVVALCPRVILIHHGHLLYDGALQGLAQRLAPFKLIRVTLHSGAVLLRDTAVGDDTVVFPNAVLYPRVTVGKRCVIHFCGWILRSASHTIPNLRALSQRPLNAGAMVLTCEEIN